MQSHINHAINHSFCCLRPASRLLLMGKQELRRQLREHLRDRFFLRAFRGFKPLKALFFPSARVIGFHPLPIDAQDLLVRIVKCVRKVAAHAS